MNRRNPEAIPAQRYHRDLATLEEARAGTDLRSDHVPIVANIPLNSKKVETARIISWNVLQADSYSGFAPLGQTSLGESSSAKQARYKRIAESLKSFVKEQDPDFIALQEITADSDLFTQIVEKLGPDYSYVVVNDDVVQGGGCITFYNNKHFKSHIDSQVTRAKQLNHPQLNGNRIAFQSLDDSNVFVDVLNVHPQFNKNPKKLETLIKSALQNDPTKTTIVVGDFNCTIAPLNSANRNIITNVAPSVFRNDKHQGAEAIDGCFYSKDKTNHQAEIYHLNPKSGLAYRPLPPLDLASLTESQRKEMLRLRMTLCVDELFEQEKMITVNNRQYTIFEYENVLNHDFGTNEFVVRLAVTLNNDSPNFGFKVPRDVYYYLLFTNAVPELQFEKQNIDQSEYFIYADSTQLIALTDIFKKMLTNDFDVEALYAPQIHDLLQLEAKVDALERGYQMKKVPSKETVNDFKNRYAQLEAEMVGKVTTTLTDEIIVELPQDPEVLSLLAEFEPKTTAPIKKNPHSSRTCLSLTEFFGGLFSSLFNKSGNKDHELNEVREPLLSSQRLN